MKKIILTSLALNLICAAGVFAQETVVNEQPDVKLSVEQTSVQESVEVKPVADKKVVKNNARIKKLKSPYIKRSFSSKTLF